MYYMTCMFVSSLHRESTNSLIMHDIVNYGERELANLFAMAVM